MIDPTKYGATKVIRTGGIDPTKYGATKLGGTGIPTSAPPTVSQSFSERLNSLLNKPIFNMAENKSGLIGTGFKSAANTAQSFGKFAKGTVDFLNPKNTFNTLGQLPEAISGFAGDASAAIASEKHARQLEAKVRAITGKAPVAQPLNPRSITPNFGKATFESVAPPAIQEATKGNVSGAIQSVAEDPFQLAPLFFMAKGFAEAKTIKTGKTTPEGLPEYKSLLETEIGQKIDAGISRTADIVTKPVTVPAKGILKYGKKLAEFATSQATGLSPKSIQTIIENPKEFSAKQAASYSREGIASEVKKGIDDRIADLQETGKGYEAVRTSKERVTLDIDAVQGVLDKYRIKVDETGKVVTSQESLPLSAGDKAALQDFVNTFNTQNLSANAFLNARTALSNMAKFDSTKTSASTTLARELRTVYDGAGKEQIKGLKELDKIYSAEKEVLSKIKRDYLQADGTFKDGAISKIANLNKAGREQVLSRLEAVVPGIGKKLTILNALEDMANAQGQKVGTYGRALLGGAGLATGNIAAIVAAILASPAIASQILRGYGNLRGIPKAVIEKTIKAVEKALTTDITDVKIGLSVKDTGNSFYNRLNKYEAEGLKKAKTEVKKKENVNPLTTEARIPKTVKVWRKNRFSDGGAYLDYRVIRKEDNITLYQGGDKGQHWTPDKKYAEQFGNVKEKTGSFYQIDNGNRMTNVYVEVPKPPKLDPLLSEARKYKSADEFVKAQTTSFRGAPNDNVRISTTGRNDLGDGFYITKDKYLAKEYAIKTTDGSVHGYAIDKNAKILDWGSKEYEDIINAKPKDANSIEWLRKNGVDGVEYKQGDVTTNSEYPNSVNIKIVNPDVIKTKSQLTDIWKKANKKKVSK